MSQRVRAESVAMATGNGGASFAGFTDFDADVASGASSPKQQDLGGSSSGQASPKSLRMAKRTSILDGVSQPELLMQHRLSLAGLARPPPATAGAAAGTIPTEEELQGVTLSKRHTYTKKEYEAGHEEQLYNQLQGFRAGFDDDDDTADRRRDEDEDDDSCSSPSAKGVAKT